jgi:hypothetical protein
VEGEFECDDEVLRVKLHVNIIRSTFQNMECSRYEAALSQNFRLSSHLPERPRQDRAEGFAQALVSDPRQDNARDGVGGRRLVVMPLTTSQNVLGSRNT